MGPEAVILGGFGCPTKALGPISRSDSLVMAQRGRSAGLARIAARQKHMR